MNGTSRKSLSTQNILNVITRSLCLDKNKDKPLLNGEKETHQMIKFIPLINEFHSLLNILGCTSNSSDREKDVVIQEITSKTLDIRWERCREKHCLPSISLRHTLLLYNTTNLGLKSHIQHTISLIQTKELDAFHRNTSTLNKIYKTTRCRNEKITSTFNLAKLISDICSSVDTYSGNSSTVGEFTGFIVDLGCKFTCRCEYEGIGVIATTSVIGWGGSTLGEHGHDDGE
mmetsp:Transcript_23825/g.35340  ORF Transcript_23825/g.35340 Transcript_23825/m.35340 type:complete len:230 (+) Transcript_23825:453-1142(+)